jgi:hypothetical protein
VALYLGLKGEISDSAQIRCDQTGGGIYPACDAKPAFLHMQLRPNGRV